MQNIFFSKIQKLDFRKQKEKYMYISQFLIETYNSSPRQKLNRKIIFKKTTTHKCVQIDANLAQSSPSLASV